MAKRSRDKGKRGEREAVALLREMFPEAARSYGQSRSGSDAPDVEGTPYWVEVSFGKAPSPHGKMLQAIEATDGRTPLVLTRRDRGEWLVTMRWGDWLEVAK